MSDRWSIALPWACSGDMYETVPRIRPSWVTDAVFSSLSSDALGAGASLARPKSRIFKRPSSSTMTFSGLRSRCVMPLAWAVLSASARAMASLKKRASLSPVSGTSVESVCPETRSIVMKRVPPASSIEWSVTMFGWFRPATALASRSKRARRSGSLATSGGNTLSATSRLSLVSSARYTSPMPPRPSFPLIR